MISNCLICFIIFNLPKYFCLSLDEMNAKEVLNIAPHKWIGNYEHKRDMIYCNTTLCPGDEKPVICDCKNRINSNCVYYFPKRQIDFRLQMTLVINAFRNTIAGKLLQGFQIPDSSDMNAVTYNMGLEYSAQCSAHRCSKEVETCIKTTLFPVIKQFVIKIQLPEFTTMRKLTNSIFAKLVKSMTKNLNYKQEQHKDLNISGEYVKSVKTEWNVWQTALWSRATAFGCSIKRLKGGMKNIVVFIVCNFGASKENPKGAIYKLGKSCTSCEHKFSHNYHFHSICGCIGMVPISDIYNGNTKTNWEKNRIIFVFGGILLLLCYNTDI